MAHHGRDAWQDFHMSLFHPAARECQIMAGAVEHIDLPDGCRQLCRLVDPQPSVPPSREAVGADDRRRMLGPKRSTEFWILPGCFFCLLLVLFSLVPHHDRARYGPTRKAEVAILHISSSELHVSYTPLSLPLYANLIPPANLLQFWNICHCQNRPDFSDRWRERLHL